MKRLSLLPVIFLYLCGAIFTQALAETIFTYQAKESATDTRREYNRELLRLALEKTLSKYGPYKLVASPSMNTARSLEMVREGALTNFFVRKSVSQKALKEMGYVPFPVERGIVGYRVFFVSPKAKDRLKTVKKLDQLREYTIGQGIGWLDTHILRKNGFKVITGSSYEGLFRMVAQSRIDLFARGANELLSEYESHKDIKGFMYDDTIALYYPLPRFFFTHKSNIKAIKRIKEGLIAAYEDGSFQKLWSKYNGPSIEFVNLKKRQIFRIDNPFLNGLDKSYEKYIYYP